MSHLRKFPFVATTHTHTLETFVGCRIEVKHDFILHTASF